MYVNQRKRAPKKVAIHSKLKPLREITFDLGKFKQKRKRWTTKNTILI